MLQPLWMRWSSEIWMTFADGDGPNARKRAGEIDPVEAQHHVDSFSPSTLSGVIARGDPTWSG